MLVRKVVQVGTEFAFEEDKWKEMQIVTAVLPADSSLVCASFASRFTLVWTWRSWHRDIFCSEEWGRKRKRKKENKNKRKQETKE
jgi:hypothetical protein